MKKFSLLGICLFGAFALSAQTDVVKEVEQALKGSNPDYKAALAKIQPALSNEATKNDALTWKLAGQANEGIYDGFLKQMMLGTELSNDQKKAAGTALLDLYNDYLTALPLDQHPDKKGVMKPGKLTKGMVKSLADNYRQLSQAGVLLFEAGDYMGAYNIWEMYVTVPNNPILGDKAPKADPDTVVGQIMYYQLLSALSANENAKALSKVEPIEKSGYQNIETFVYGIEAARRLNDSIAMFDLAKQGYDKYGTQNISFVGELINDRLNKNDFAGCEKLVNEAIAATPADNKEILSQLYDILGIVYEQQENNDKAIEYLNKAIEINPEVAKNYYDLGRIIYNQAVKLDETVETEAQRKAEVDPKLLQAAEYFEKAYALDSANLSQIPNILYRLYYRLGDGYQDKAEEWSNK